MCKSNDFPSLLLHHDSDYKELRQYFEDLSSYYNTLISDVESQIDELSKLRLGYVSIVNNLQQMNHRIDCDDLPFT